MFTSLFRRERGNGTPPVSVIPPLAKEDITGRLRQATAELQDLEQAIFSREMDVRVLAEFRLAVNHIRQTAWIVEEWLKQQAANRDPYTLYPALNAERIRRAAQMNDELATELDSTGYAAESDGLQRLYQATERLFLRLARIFRHKQELAG
ncbi:MAG: hypothetical protein HY234_03340 [Acidobacteria bacterium]|nr:hypothetical protein [Acidobacteriota bacterium]